MSIDPANGQRPLASATVAASTPRGDAACGEDVGEEAAPSTAVGGTDSIPLARQKSFKESFHNRARLLSECSNRDMGRDPAAGAEELQQQQVTDEWFQGKQRQRTRTATDWEHSALLGTGPRVGALASAPQRRSSESGSGGLTSPVASHRRLSYVSLASTGSSLDDPHSWPELQRSLASGNDRPTDKDISKYSRSRSKQKDKLQVLERGGGLESDATVSPRGRPQSPEERFDAVVAFVARRVHQRIQEGSRMTVTPPLLELFDERRFQAVPQQERSLRRRDRCKCLNPFKAVWKRNAGNETTEGTSVTAADVFTFVRKFATWCGLPMDLLVVALIYADRLVEAGKGERVLSAGGVLTPRSWRPVLLTCLVLASKVWEDWSVCNFEAAMFVSYTRARMLRLELLAMDVLEWNVQITAEAFAPYFWAAKRLLETGRDDSFSNVSSARKEPDGFMRQTTPLLPESATLPS